MRTETRVVTRYDDNWDAPIIRLRLNDPKINKEVVLDFNDSSLEAEKLVTSNGLIKVVAGVQEMACTVEAVLDDINDDMKEIWKRLG